MNSKYEFVWVGKSIQISNVQFVYRPNHTNLYKMYLLQPSTIVTCTILDDRLVLCPPAATVPVEELERAAVVVAESEAVPVTVGVAAADS